VQFHKIPQHVTGYEGRIIGKFTARQFTYLAIGGIVIFIVVSAPIPSKLKFVLGAIDVGFSALMALVNYEGRSTDTWIVHFLKAVLSPTQRIWLKKEIVPEYLLPSYQVPMRRKGQKKKTGEELERFLQFWSGTEKPSDLTAEEKEFLEKLKLNRGTGLRGKLLTKVGKDFQAPEKTYEQPNLSTN